MDVQDTLSSSSPAAESPLLTEDGGEMSKSKSESTDIGSGNSPRGDSVDFDSVLKAIGQSVTHQVLQSLILMSFIVPYGMSILSFVFIGYEPPHVCAKVNETHLLSKYGLLNDTSAINVIYESCLIRVTSNKSGTPKDVALTQCIEGHSFEGGKDVSMKTEWGLVCEEEGTAELLQTMLHVGMVIGCFTINPLPDRFGRKKMLVISSIFSNLFELLVAFSPTISIAILFKTLAGIFIQNQSTINQAYGQELIQTKSRDLFGIGMVLVWTCGLIYFGGVAYAIQNYGWRYLQIFAAVSGIPPLICVYFVEESVAWLLAQGEHARALEIVERTCDKSGTDFVAAKKAYDQCVVRTKTILQNKTSGDKAVAKYGIVDIIRHRKLLVTILVLLLAYFTDNVTYIGLFLTSAISNINHYFMFIILSATEFPSSILCLFLVKGTGRRTIIITSLSMTAIWLLISALLVGLGSTSSEHSKNASTAFFILGKFCINLSFTCLYAFTPEFFPTTLRNISFGLCVFAARVGGMVAPFLYPLFKIANWAPGTLLTALCVITISLYPLVPETKGRELPTTMESFEALFEKDTKSRGCKQRRRAQDEQNCKVIKVDTNETEMGRRLQINAKEALESAQA